MAPCRFAPGWRRAHATGATWLLAISMGINQAHQGTHVGPLRGPGGCAHPTTACHASPPSATRRRGGPRPPQVVPWVNMGSYVAVTGTQVRLGIAKVGEPAPPIPPCGRTFTVSNAQLERAVAALGPEAGVACAGGAVCEYRLGRLATADLSKAARARRTPPSTHPTCLWARFHRRGRQLGRSPQGSLLWTVCCRPPRDGPSFCRRRGLPSTDPSEHVRRPVRDA